MATESLSRGAASKAKAAPSDPLKGAVQHLVETLADRAVSSVTGKVTSTAGRLADYAEGNGGSLLGAVTGAQKLAEGKSPASAALSAGLSGMGNTVKDKAKELKDTITGGGKDGDKGNKLKVTNIIEQVDVGVPVQVAYDQWTRFTEFPTFMKKVESVEQLSDEKVAWRARILWSHRKWEATIVEQVPDERIIWRSEGEKGHVDGAVTFHELAPQLTRVILVLEYHPQGLFERTGNLWRAQGRRARLELKHFQRHVMTESVLHPDEIEGWRGEIRDGEVVEEPESRDQGDEEPESPEESEEPDRPKRRRPARSATRSQRGGKR